jgi:uncharacterized alpha-E superfamily protein
MKEAGRMLSRVADNLYWMSRYLERAEHTARVMGVQWNLMLEHEPGSAERRWKRVTASLGRREPLEGDAFAAAQSFALAQIVGGIAEARENARQVREQISSEMWEELNRLFHESKRMGTPDLFHVQGFDLVLAVIRSSNLFQGITDSTMSHGEGWQFIQTGRFMERVEAAAKLIDLHFAEYFDAAEPVSGSEHMEWLGLLRSCTAFEAYCKVYTADLRPERAAEFLLLNADFPHSIRFGAERLLRSLEAIHQSAGARKTDRVGKLAGRLTAALSYTPLEEIMSNLHEFTTNIRRLCGQIHGGIYQVYISYPLDAALEG